MLAVVCPGQGSQKPGFLSPWLELDGVEEQLAAMSEKCLTDLVTHGTVSDADTIRDTAVAQPLLVSAGIVAGQALETRDRARSSHPSTARLEESELAARSTVLGADVVAGHSVGEVTAAALTSVLSVDDALAFVRVRSQAMAQAATEHPTGMAAVVGGDREEVLASINAHELTPANINSSAQIVAAGLLENIEQLKGDAPAKTRVIPLQVAGAFHTEFMAPASRTLEAFATEVSAQDPAESTVLLSNAGGARVTSGSAFVASMVSQVASAVDWQACMAAFTEHQVSGILELNPAGTLTGLAKRELPGVALCTVNTPADMDAALAFVHEHAGTGKDS